MVYLDNAATTFVDKEAISIITQSLNEDFINPSALYNKGRDKFNEIQDCKNRIAKNLGLNTNQNNIYFTSGGCEGNNWIIKGCVAEYYRANMNEGLINHFSRTIKKPHIITSSFEHHSVINACKQLEELNIAKITYVKPDAVTGIINPIDIQKHFSTIHDNYQTILVSVMWVNNVLGTIQPIEEIGNICRIHNIKFHTDAVQAMGNVRVNLANINIDFLTASGHKFHAPKGIGFVYMKDAASIQPLISGGGQEYGLRAGTENLPYIKAITCSLEKYNNDNNINSKCLYIERLKMILMNNLSQFSNCIIFPSSYNIGTVNVAFKDLESDMLVYNLGNAGYMISVGSACDNGNFEDSHVLSALQYSSEYINGNIRITFNCFNTENEIYNFIETLRNEVCKLRGY